MVDYAVLNQRLFEGGHEAVRDMVGQALAVAVGPLGEPPPGSGLIAP